MTERGIHNTAAILKVDIWGSFGINQKNMSSNLQLGRYCEKEKLLTKNRLLKLNTFLNI